jgi:ribosomal protein S27E
MGSGPVDFFEDGVLCPVCRGAKLLYESYDQSINCKCCGRKWALVRKNG